MSNKSSSKTSRSYETNNISQQGEANVIGDRNSTTIYRADAITLDNIAKALAAGVEDLSEAGRRQVEAALSTTEKINRDSLDGMEGVSKEALKRNEAVSRAALQFSEKSSMSAMDFVANFTEREQIGSEGEQLRTLQYVAAAVAVALVGIAWASKGSFKA
ncbi:hypothetical protein [Billgrantia bachuensis]|uniref:Uncharacterized protein n=1 Tax=Billgrantia bachuensis TaxID=2717286 RepID=A0ABX0PNU2_9GAMM|nr:hypothetical protein [Halomonas bachuensis]NIC03973.1 hypothetical protein [Halomonas bachuensis]